MAHQYDGFGFHEGELAGDTNTGRCASSGKMLRIHYAESRIAYGFLAGLSYGARARLDIVKAGRRDQCFFQFGGRVPSNADDIHVQDPQLHRLGDS